MGCEFLRLEAVWNVVQILYYLLSLDLVNGYICELTTVLLEYWHKGECCVEVVRFGKLWRVNVKIHGLAETSFVLDPVLNCAAILCKLWFNRSVHWAGLFCKEIQICCSQITLDKKNYVDVKQSFLLTRDLYEQFEVYLSEGSQNLLHSWIWLLLACVTSL